MKQFLNVGGNNKNIPVPPHYQGWNHRLLDIDPRGQPDIVCDARQLTTLPAAEYDAIYCSHNLEHYYRHDVFKVLAGFHHLLKPSGFAQIIVPDIGELIQIVAQNNLDIDDLLYQSPAGPITVRDVLYGFGIEIERSGNHFYGHKTGFTAQSLRSVLTRSGFDPIYIGTGNLELNAFAFTEPPDEESRQLIGLAE